MPRRILRHRWNTDLSSRTLFDKRVEILECCSIMTNSVRNRPSDPPALEVTSLRKSYPGDVLALDGLDLTIPSGTVFGLLGPNGAGKTTAVKILATLARPDEGTAVVAGVDVLTDPGTVRRLVGYVSQRSGADVHATGTENLTLQARVHDIDRHEARGISARLMDRFGLTEAADRVVKTWSGGMRRRLDIALAMVHSPKVLFLDEPTTGLDPEVRADLWNEIRRLRDEDGVTVLLTTHYLEEADQLADTIAIVDRGKVVAEGTPSQLKDGMKGDGLHIDLTRQRHDQRGDPDYSTENPGCASSSSRGGRSTPEPTGERRRFPGSSQPSAQLGSKWPR